MLGIKIQNFSLNRQPGDGPDYRPLLKQIQKSGETHLIIDVGIDKILSVLRQASEVKMMEEYISYIIVSLDTHTIDFEELKFMRANITAIRLLDPTSYDVTNGKKKKIKFEISQTNFLYFLLSNSRLGAW